MTTDTPNPEAVAAAIAWAREKHGRRVDGWQSFGQLADAASRAVELEREIHAGVVRLHASELLTAELRADRDRLQAELATELACRPVVAECYREAMTEAERYTQAWQRKAQQCDELQAELAAARESLRWIEGHAAHDWKRVYAGADNLADILGDVCMAVANRARAALAAREPEEGK